MRIGVCTDGLPRREIAVNDFSSDRTEGLGCSSETWSESSVGQPGVAQPIGPLVRSLLASNMVERTAPGTWRLLPLVQERLEACESRDITAAALPAIGVHCGACDATSLTWQTDLGRLCASCLELDSERGPRPGVMEQGRTQPRGNGGEYSPMLSEAHIRFNGRIRPWKRRRLSSGSGRSTIP